MRVLQILPIFTKINVCEVFKNNHIAKINVCEIIVFVCFSHFIFLIKISTLGSLISAPSPYFFSKISQTPPPTADLIRTPPPLPNYYIFYFVRVTCKTFVGKKNLFSKKVISKASLKILEVNSHA